MKADGTKCVLVVDDQPMVRETLKMLLQFEGYQVCVADNGHSALEIFQPGKFALIFTDFEMPGMNGHELASIIKAHAPDQPIIMVTAYADMLLAGDPLPHIDALLVKPWTIDEIRAAITEAMPVL